MLTKTKVLEFVFEAIKKLNIDASEDAMSKIAATYTEPQFGDYSTNAALILAKEAKMKPLDLAGQIIENLDQSLFEQVEIAGPGFINFKLKTEELLKGIGKELGKMTSSSKEKILLEYFQPNIAKPLHIGHLRTAIIGDAIKRLLLYSGAKVESDTHMGDWGTQFGYLIMAYKKHGAVDDKIYAKLNAQAEADPKLHDEAKEEFSRLEKGDDENRKIWQEIVATSVEEFLKINDLMDILPFDHHWPESFYEDKMPKVIESLKKKKLLVESQGAQVVNLEDANLGFAIMIKSDGSTTYLLRDMATFIYRAGLGFEKQLYVVDSRQSNHFAQMFEILKRLGVTKDAHKNAHLSYGYISFKGQALSTRKGNMVLANDVIVQMEEKVAQIIQEKNPDLKDKSNAVKAISKGALKYYDLSHNRNSDYEFNWDDALDFNGNSGPYLQYVYARLSSILRKETGKGSVKENVEISATERQVMFELTKFNDMVEDGLKDYLPNLFANYLYQLAGLLNKFYHESPVIKETDKAKKQFRLRLVTAGREVFGKGLELLGIEPLEEM